MKKQKIENCKYGYMLTYYCDRRKRVVYTNECENCPYYKDYRNSLIIKLTDVIKEKILCKK